MQEGVIEWYLSRHFLMSNNDIYVEEVSQGTIFKTRLTLCAKRLEGQVGLSFFPG